jgi:AcrR family transcriptional regulator
LHTRGGFKNLLWVCKWRCPPRIGPCAPVESGGAQRAMGRPHARLYRIVVGRRRMRVPAPAARRRRTRPCLAGFRRDAPAGRELHLVHASSAAAGRVGAGTYVNTGYGQAVATKVARRTQAERTEATTSALVDAARALFAREGYDATSLDAVAARAGVTKGAVYHHFEGKRQLFEAVFSREVERVATPLGEAYARKKDPWDALNAACRAFLDESLDPGLQRIVLLDALTAIGWEQVRRLETPLLERCRSGSCRLRRPAASHRDHRGRSLTFFTARSARPR